MSRRPGHELRATIGWDTCSSISERVQDLRPPAAREGLGGGEVWDILHLTHRPCTGIASPVTVDHFGSSVARPLAVFAVTHAGARYSRALRP